LAKLHNTAAKATPQYLVVYTYIPFSCSNTLLQIVTVHIPNLPVQAIGIGSLEYKNCANWLWERKVLRKIFGPICVAGYWRSRTNEEVRQLYRELDIVTEIKKGRLRWLGHVERMSEERVVKRLYQNTLEGSRSVGRPRLRWMDDMREDLRGMGVTSWRIYAHRKDDWKMVVKEAKVLQGL